MADYHTITAKLVVKPERDELFSEMATHIELEDEGAGAYVVVTQPGGRTDKTGVAFDAKEWPLIRQAIEDMLAVAQGIGAEPLARTDGGFGNGD